MALRSRIFANDAACNACLLHDSAHIKRGDRGDAVAKIQAAVTFLDQSTIAAGEVDAKLYGPSTAAAVLTFKRRRKIINAAYQTQADDIVGKMTIKAIDDELFSRQIEPAPAGAGSGQCTVSTSSAPGVGVARLRSAFSSGRLV